MLTIVIVITIAIVMVNRLRHTKKCEKMAVEDNDTLSLYKEKRSPQDTMEDFFKLEVGQYLKENYKSMDTWEFTHLGYHFNAKVCEVKMWMKDGKIEYIKFHPSDAMRRRFPMEQEEAASDEQRSSPVQTDEEVPEEPKEEPKASKIQEWIFTNTAAIQNSIDKAMRRKNGFYAEYELPNVFSEEEIEELVATLNSHTEYDVSAQDSVLRFGFQHLL